MKMKHPGLPGAGSTNVLCDPKVRSASGPRHGFPSERYGPRILSATAQSAWFAVQPVQADVTRKYFPLCLNGADSIELYGRTRGAGFDPEVKRRIILGTYVLSRGKGSNGERVKPEVGSGVVCIV